MSVLSEIRFGFLPGTRVAGMGEPWRDKIDETIACLKQQGIGAVVTLTEDNPYNENFTHAGLQHLFSPINDTEPPSRATMDDIIVFMEKALADGLGVAVYCCEGRGRTGTVLCAWLGKKLGLDGKSAIEKIYSLRFHTVLTYSQQNFILDY